MAASYPAKNWDNYLTDRQTPDWSKIVVAGHSQGSGHACYFAKRELVKRVLLFSGPNDYSDFSSQSAEWLGTSGTTPVDRHFAYLSLLDEFVDFDKQLANLQALKIYPSYDTSFVDQSNPPYGNSHCLYTTQSPGLAIFHHNSPVRSSTINDKAWEYMLASTIISNVHMVDPNKLVDVYPNPTSSILTIKFKSENDLGIIKVLDLNGRVVLTQSSSSTKSISIDLSDLPSGLYFIRIKHLLLKAVKQ